MFAVTFTAGVGTLVGVGLVALALVVMAGLWVGSFWYRRDEKQEDRDRSRIELAAKLQEAGLPHFAQLIVSLVVRDWDGLYRQIKSLVERAKEVGQLLVLLTPSFYWALPQLLEQPEHLAKIATAVGRAQQAKKANGAAEAK